MQIQDITNQVLDATEKGKLKSVASYFADNFKLTGPMPTPQNKDQYLDTMAKLTSGIPNWNFNRHDLRVEGQTVVVPVRVTGTQSRPIPSLMPGMPDLPASNRSLSLPNETIRVKFQGERIVEVHVDPVPGGGVTGILEQLGVQIPVTGRSDKSSK